MVAAVSVLVTGDALLLHVGDLTSGGDLTVMTGDAAAREGGVTEQANETHHVALRSEPEQ
jgi:hypothetical protein